MIRKLLGMVFPALKPSSSRRDELETLLADSSADRASSTRMKALCCATSSGCVT